MLGTHADMGKCGGVFIHKTESPGKPRSKPKPNWNQIPGSQTGSQTKNKYQVLNLVQQRNSESRRTLLVPSGCTIFTTVSTTTDRYLSTIVQLY
jgi:hypothetical protein